jgi:hypothetical protein
VEYNQLIQALVESAILVTGTLQKIAKTTNI